MALTSRHIHGDFKGNSQGPFSPSWPKPESALEVIKAPIRQNTSHPPPPRRVSFLVLETKLDGGYPPPVFQKQEKHVHLKPQRRALKQATVQRRCAIGQSERIRTVPARAHARGCLEKIPTLLWAPQDECCGRLRMSALGVGRGAGTWRMCPVFPP